MNFRRHKHGLPAYMRRNSNFKGHSLTFMVMMKKRLVHKCLANACELDDVVVVVPSMVIFSLSSFFFLSSSVLFCFFLEY